MLNIRSKKTNMRKVLEYMLVIITILECNSIYTRTVNYNFHISLINYIVISLFSLFVILIAKKNSKYSVSSKCIFLLLYTLIYFVICVRDNYVRYIFNFIILLPIMYVYFKENDLNKKGIMSKYSKIICFLSVLSLLFYFFGTVLNLIPSKSILVNWGGIKTRQSYFFLHFSTQTISLFGKLVYRNTGIFTEAPMYAFILILGLISEIIFPTGKSKLKRTLIFIAILTTLSTTGITISIAILLFYYIFNKEHESLKKIVKIFLLPIICIISINVFSYLISEKTDTKSYLIRMDDFNSSINAWKENIVFGNGFSNSSVTESYMSENVRNGLTGQSSAYGRIISEGGLYLLYIYLFPLIMLTYSGLKSKNKMLGIIGISFIFILLNINIPYQSITIIFIAFIISLNELLKNNNQLKKERKFVIDEKI